MSADGPSNSENTANSETAPPPPPQTTLINNWAGLTSFILGIASVFLFHIGILPLLGIVFGAIGIGTFDPKLHTNRWMGITGLTLSVLYMLMNIGSHQAGSQSVAPQPQLRPGEFRYVRPKR